MDTENKDTEKKETSETKSDTHVDKAAVVEAVADQLKKEVEAREKELARYKEKLAKEAQAKLEKAPEDIQARYKGKEIDLSTLEAIETDVVRHNEMVERAKAEAKAQVDAYKKEVFEKYGVRIPDAPKAKEAPKQNSVETKDENRKVTRISDIAEKEKLSFDDLKAITSNVEAMQAFVAERKKIVNNH